jgi:hypothetical protein
LLADDIGLKQSQASIFGHRNRLWSEKTRV